MPPRNGFGGPRRRRCVFACAGFRRVALRRKKKSRGSTHVTPAPHARPIRSTRSAKPTDAYCTLSHGPAARSRPNRPARVRAPRPERRSAEPAATGLRARSEPTGSTDRQRGPLGRAPSASPSASRLSRAGRKYDVFTQCFRFQKAHPETESMTNSLLIIKPRRSHS